MPYFVALFAMKTLYGDAARDHLAAGNPIYYREPDTPAGLCLKEYPDGRRELVKFSVAHGEEFVSEASPRLRLGLLEGKLSVGDDFNNPLPDDLLELIEAVDKSTKAANDALDDALSFIADRTTGSNRSSVQAGWRRRSERYVRERSAGVHK